jgi:hypothetical protein
MNRLGIPVLCVLDEEHHQKGHNHGAGVYDQLPRVRIVEGRTAREPHNDDDQGQHNAHGEPTASANCLAK